MMTSNVKYNTLIAKNILNIFLYLTEFDIITSKIFEEEIGYRRVMFYYVMKDFNNLFSSLKMNYKIVRLWERNEENNSRYHKYMMHYTTGGKYYYQLNKMSKYELKRYSLVIIYLMIKNNEMITLRRLREIFPNFCYKKLNMCLNNISDITGYEFIHFKRMYKPIFEE